jgi:hypothetical protein
MNYATLVSVLTVVMHALYLTVFTNMAMNEWKVIVECVIQA